MNDRTKLLEAIRSKYIGSAEEHEALKSLMDDYREAYDRGWERGVAQGRTEKEYDLKLVALAEAYQRGCPIDAKLLEWVDYEESDYIPDEIAQRLVKLGVTPEMFSLMITKFNEIQQKKTP